MTAVPDSAAAHDFARRLDFTTLQLFVAVGETGSIGRAAAREARGRRAASAAPPRARRWPRRP